MPKPDVEALIQGLFAPDHADDCYQRLQARVPDALPYLLAALKDPRVGARALGLSHFQSPLDRISELLLGSGSPDAAGAFLGMLSFRKARLRHHGAMYLAKLAQPNCIGGVTRLLASDDKELRTYTMFGIGHALNAKRGEPEFFAAIWPSLIPLLRLNDALGAAHRLLAQIDPVAAAPVLLGAEHFSLGNPRLGSVIEALNDSRTLISREILRPLMAQLEPLADGYPRCFELGEALLAYASNPAAETEPRLRAFLQSPNEHVQTSAARALAAFRGVRDHSSKLIGLACEKGLQALTGPERNYYSASIYYNDVQNGGPWQYIRNPTANYHAQIIEGLSSIGAHKTAQVLSELGKVFGPAGPSADRHLRNAQADSFTAEQTVVVDHLYAEFPSLGENIELFLELYVVANAAGFLHCKEPAR
jgi:hypothetical protein